MEQGQLNRMCGSSRCAMLYFLGILKYSLSRLTLTLWTLIWGT